MIDIQNMLRCNDMFNVMDSPAPKEQVNQVFGEVPIVYGKCPYYRCNVGIDPAVPEADKSVHITVGIGGGGGGKFVKALDRAAKEVSDKHNIQTMTMEDIRKLYLGRWL